MSRLDRIPGRRIVSVATVVRVVQLACFAAAPAVLILALRGAARLASTPGEVLLGVLGGGSLALLLVLTGLVLPVYVRVAGGSS